jgi:DNA-binding MarR family transcriptional regulator
MQDVFDFLRRQPGDSFTSADIARQIGGAEVDVETALKELESRGLVDKRRQAAASAEYIVSPRAPNL